jgi:hypothetical protein
MREFSLRDLLSARQDPGNEQVIHIWSFKLKVERKGWCCKSEERHRVMEDTLIMADHPELAEEWANRIQCAIEGVTFEGCKRIDSYE